LPVTPSATSGNHSGVFRLIANLPSCRRFLRPPSTKAPSLHRSYLNCRAMCSVTGHVDPAGWFFSTSGFHLFFATKPVSSETSKAERRSVGDHSSIRDSWPIAFSGYPRGPRVGCETRCPKHAAPNLPAETRSRTRVSREPEQPPLGEDPQDGADSIRDTQAVCGFRCWASKHTPLFHTIRTIVAIFRTASPF
jgi:hypothetical protein